MAGFPVPILLALTLIVGCRPADVRPGSVVKMRYAMIMDGASADERELKFVSGSGEILEGLDLALAGLRAGDRKTVILTPGNGFGAIDPRKIGRFPKEKFSGLGAELKPGMTVSGVLGGKAASARVTRVDRDEVTLDFNHPRAGKTVRFEVEILDVR